MKPRVNNSDDETVKKNKNILTTTKHLFLDNSTSDKVTSDLETMQISTDFVVTNKFYELEV